MQPIIDVVIFLHLLNFQFPAAPIPQRHDTWSTAAQEDMFWWPRPVQVAEFLSRPFQALAFPDQLFDAIFEEESVSSKTPIRLYGGALLSECQTTVLGPQSKGTGGQNGSRGQSPCPAGHLQLESRTSAVSKEIAEGYFEKLGYCCFFLAGIQACCRLGKKGCACSESLGGNPMYPSKGSLRGARRGALGRGWGSMGASGEIGQAAASQEGGQATKRCGELGEMVREGKGARPGPAAAPRGAGGKRGPRRCPGLGQRPAVPAGIALIMWNALYTAEKAIIRWSLLAEACYFAVQFLGECPRAEEESVQTVHGRAAV